MGSVPTLIDLVGLVALLLWGVHMVRTGLQRAYGTNFRRLLSRTLNNRIKAFLAGLGITALLQSSTATGLMVASFAAGGFVDLKPALAAMLGANVGTTLIVQALSFQVSRLAPLLILVGVLMFRRAIQSQSKDLARVAIGLGLTFMALEQMVRVITPFEDQPGLRALLGLATAAPIAYVLIAAAVTWAAHSSVAIVLITMSFAAKGVVPPTAAFALVLGANLGSAINPVLEGPAGDDPAARRMPMGNLFTRLAGCLVLLPVLEPFSKLWMTFFPDAGHATALFHMAFNLVIAAVFMAVLGPFSRMLIRMFPSRIEPADPSQPLHLDYTALMVPSVGITCAAREALRMSDVLEAMLRNAQDAFQGDDKKKISETKQLDDQIDRLNFSIKRYLASFDSDALSAADDRRFSEILTFITNVEHAGDVIDRNLMEIATKKIKRGLVFPDNVRSEVFGLIERLGQNLRSANAVLLTGDAREARRLAEEKEAFREIETRVTEAHFSYLRSGQTEAVEANSLHLDLIRDLKRINAHLVAAAAYPVLEGQGILLSSRIRDTN